VTRFGLKDKAEALGATVALLEGPGPVDVAALARQAVADGADLLGVAGGDGTQALVAGIAAEHDLPLLVISAGTRNHFALDRGTLGMFAVTVNSAIQAAGLLAGTHSAGLTRLAAPEVVIDADTSQIPVGVDGEALVLETPVRCTLRPAALRVRVPRNRPGVPDPKPVMDWKRLQHLALTTPSRHGQRRDALG